MNIIGATEDFIKQRMARPSIEWTTETGRSEEERDRETREREREKGGREGGGEISHSCTSIIQHEFTIPSSTVPLTSTGLVLQAWQVIGFVNLCV